METSNLPFRFETDERCSILCLTPHLTEIDWGDVEQVGTEIIQRLDGMPIPALLVDLSALNYMGSSQVALVVRVWKSIKARDGKMAVQVSHPLVREVLKIAGLNNLWDIVETRAEALKSLGISTERPRTSGVGGIILGIVGLVAAAIGLSLAVYAPGQFLAADVLMILRYVAGGLAIVGGIWGAAAATGSGRWLSVGVILAAAVLVTVQVLQQVKVI